MTEILVLGDSHAKVFTQASALFPGFRFSIIAVNGATASGLENPNSITQAMPIFSAAIAESHAPLCITLLGEVDTGFVIWYRLQKYGNELVQLLAMAVNNYLRLIEELARFRDVIVISAPLPTISDYQKCGKVANMRSRVTASQTERTQLTISFNQMLASSASSSKWFFLNLDQVSLGVDNVVKPELLNRDPSDHHYNRQKYLELLAPELRLHLNQWLEKRSTEE